MLLSLILSSSRVIVSLRRTLVLHWNPMSSCGTSSNSSTLSPIECHWNYWRYYWFFGGKLRAQRSWCLELAQRRRKKVALSGWVAWSCNLKWWWVDSATLHVYDLSTGACRSANTWRVLSAMYGCGVFLKRGWRGFWFYFVIAQSWWVNMQNGWCECGKLNFKFLFYSVVDDFNVYIWLICDVRMTRDPMVHVMLR